MVDDTGVPLLLGLVTEIVACITGAGISDLVFGSDQSQYGKRSWSAAVL